MATNSNNNIQSFKGSWDYISSENFDEILKELGINRILRTIARALTPRLIIDENDGKWSFRSETTFKTRAYQFTEEIPFEDVTPDGQQVTITIRFENGKWIEKDLYKSGKELTVQRSINNQDQMEVNLKIGNVQATELYRRSK